MAHLATAHPAPAGFRSSTAASRDLLPYLVVFAIAFVVLCATLDRSLNIYDEGIMLTAAMRVRAGQVPYRDFYYIYGPALPYLNAGLFKLFGTSVLVMRLHDIVLKCFVCTTLFAILTKYSRRYIAVLTTAIMLVWMLAMNLNGSATTPVSLFSMIDIWVLLPAFSQRPRRSRYLLIGILAGITALFRLDSGIALLLLSALLLAAASFYRAPDPAPRWRELALTILLTLAGFALILAPLAIAYSAVGSWADVKYDLFSYPAKYYRVSRRTPFSILDVFSKLAVLVPIAAVLLSAWLSILLWLRRSNPANRKEGSPGVAAMPLLISFGLLAVAMYVKSLVRMDIQQNYLAHVPAVLLLAVSWQHYTEFPRALRVVPVIAFCVASVTALRFAEHQVRVQLDRRSMLAAYLLKPGSQAPLPPDHAWCQQRNPATRGLCFILDADHIHAIEFLTANTTAADPLYVGLRHHDRVFLNDNATYFAANRLPATRWSHMDPHLQNRADIQALMIADLQASRPPFVVLDSEYEVYHEPNDSSWSSGVFLLDNFIRDHYHPVRSFGELTILQQRTPSAHTLGSRSVPH